MRRSAAAPSGAKKNHVVAVEQASQLVDLQGREIQVGDLEVERVSRVGEAPLGVEILELRVQMSLRSFAATEKNPQRPIAVL